MKMQRLGLIVLSAAFILGGALLEINSEAAIWDDLANAFNKIKDLDKELKGAWDQVAGLQGRINDLISQVDQKTGIISTLEREANNAKNAVNAMSNQLQDLSNKVSNSIQGVGITTASIVDIGVAIQRAVDAAKADKVHFESAAKPSAKMDVIAKILQDILPTLSAMRNAINTVGIRLIRIYDEPKYQEVAKVVEQMNGLIAVVEESEKLLVDLAKMVASFNQ